MGIAKIKNEDRAHFHSEAGACEIGKNLIIRNLTGIDIDMNFMFQDTPEAKMAFVVTLKPMDNGKLHKIEIEC